MNVIFAKKLSNASMKRHKKNQHNVVSTSYKPYSPIINSETYNTSIVRKTDNLCPIEGCEGTLRDKFGMYRHFGFRHHHATLIIEGDGLLPKCPLCSMHTKNLDTHMKSTTCSRLQDRRRNESLQKL